MFNVIIFILRYVIVENLKHMLASYKPEDPLYLGCTLRYPINQKLFMSGGAGKLIILNFSSHYLL